MRARRQMQLQLPPLLLLSLQQRLQPGLLLLTLPTLVELVAGFRLQMILSCVRPLARAARAARGLHTCRLQLEK